MNIPMIKGVLQNEYDLSKKLLGLIQSEQAILLEADVPSLEVLCAQKAMIAGEIGKAVAQRKSIISNLGYFTDKAGTTACIGSFKLPELETLWLSVLGIMEEAREINRLNGVLITRQIAKTQSDLQALSLNTNEMELYGPDGQATIQAGGSHSATS